MVAACPRCAARYRVDPKRIGPAGARLRCARCEAVFRVRAAQSYTPPLAAPTQPDIPLAAPPETVVEQNRPDSVDRSRMVLVADSDIEAGKQTAAAVAAWGLQPILVHDGVEAMLTIQRMLPAVVVLDTALPKMFGFQICEVVKRNEVLQHIQVVLIGAIQHRARYPRPPSELYGADVYIERPELPDGLALLLRQFGLPVDGPAASNVSAAGPSEMLLEQVAPAPTPAPPVERQVAQPAAGSAPAPATAQHDELADERAKAERLARIIVSDIVLYNPDEFAAAVRTGNVLEALEATLQEGRDLFRQRIAEPVRVERDYLEEELLRVARERRAG